MNGSDERRPGAVGLPLPGVSVRLVESEVKLRGPNVFCGLVYCRHPEAIAEASENGWFRTGDTAEVSVGGYYKLMGHKRDLIISGGFNIYPREIGDFLMEQEEVAEAAVAGQPNPICGEVPVAYIVARQSFDPADLEGALPTRLCILQDPPWFHRRPERPRTALGKVEKRLLPSWKE